MRSLDVRPLVVLALMLACAAPDAGDERAAADPMGTRVEAQGELDSAADAFRHGNAAAAAERLGAAARFYREHPDLGSSTARGAFGAVALDLERLAGEIAAGRVRDTAVVGTAIARAQVAEAEHHRGRAAAAWKRGDDERAGEELALAIDHLERAMCDARLTRSPAGVPIVRQSRTLMLALLRGTPPPDADAGLEALAREIRRLDASTHAGAG